MQPLATQKHWQDLCQTGLHPLHRVLPDKRPENGTMPLLTLGNTLPLV